MKAILRARAFGLAGALSVCFFGFSAGARGALPGGGPEPAAEAAQPVLLAQSDPCADAKAHFDVAREIGTAEALQVHIDSYGNCSFAPFAKMMIEKMGGTAAPASVVDEPVAKAPLEASPIDTPPVDTAGLPVPDADAIADALVARLAEIKDESGIRESVRFFHEGAEVSGEDVVIRNLTMEEAEGDSIVTRFRFADARLTTPTLDADGSLSADRMVLTGGETGERKRGETEWQPFFNTDKAQAFIGAVSLEQPAFLAGASPHPDAIAGRLRVASGQIQGARLDGDGAPLVSLGSAGFKLSPLRNGYADSVLLDIAEVAVSSTALSKMSSDERAIFDQLGLSDVTFGLQLDLATDREAGTLALNNLSFHLKDAFDLTLRAKLSQLAFPDSAESLAASPDAGTAMLTAARLDSVGLLVDTGILGEKFLALAAEQGGVDPIILRAVLPAQAQALALQYLGDAALAEQAGKAATALMQPNARLAVDLAPAEPIGFMDIMIAAMSGADPKTLLGRLGTTVTVNDLPPLELHAALGSALSPEAGAAVDACNQLAADSDDPRKPAAVAGIKAPADIDADAAIPACEAAHAALPADAQMSFQLGRSYAAANRFDEAVRLYTEAGNGNPIAKYELALARINGQGGPVDLPEALRLLNEVKEDVSYAKDQLATMTYMGEGLPADTGRAIQLWTEAADAGNSNSQFNLGVEYIVGTAVPIDYAKAKAYLESAIEQDHRDAAAELGKMYYRGDGSEPDYDRAYAYLSKAAELGSPTGQANAGFMLALGVGVPAKDPARAAELLLRALAQNDPDSARYLIDSQASSLDGDVRKAMQAALKASGYYTGAVDGAFGPSTIAALQSYQGSATR